MSNTGVTDKTEQIYIDLFQNNTTLLNKVVSDTVAQQRDKAINLFKANGIPRRGNENYKYSKLESNFNVEYKTDFQHEVFNQNLDDVFKCDVHNLDATTIYLINGWYYRKNQILSSLPKGVIISSFAEASKENPEIIKAHYNKYAKNEDDSLVALNTAFAQDGFFIYVPKGVIIEKPIQIVNIINSKEDLLAFSRNLIVAEENSQVKVLLCEHTLTEHKCLTNTVTETFVGKNSTFDIYNIQNQNDLTTNINSIFVHQEEHSNALTHNITLNTGVTRNNVYIDIAKEHCESHVYGLYILDKNQHVDNFSLINHAKPNCYSDELFKGVLDDNSTGVFTGKILVAKNAQKTSSSQRNNNLLLTDTARINAKPTLEIYADDVQCSHGATIGQLDETAMFYLRSRGIGKDEARILLMYAFAYEAVEKIRVPALRDKIKDLVESAFRGELIKCSSCVPN